MEIKTAFNNFDIAEEVEYIYSSSTHKQDAVASLGYMTSGLVFETYKVDNIAADLGSKTTTYSFPECPCQGDADNDYHQRHHQRRITTYLYTSEDCEEEEKEVVEYLKENSFQIITRFHRSNYTNICSNFDGPSIVYSSFSILKDGLYREVAVPLFFDALPFSIDPFRMIQLDDVCDLNKKSLLRNCLEKPVLVSKYLDTIPSQYKKRRTLFIHLISKYTDLKDQINTLLFMRHYFVMFYGKNFSPETILSEFKYLDHPVVKYYMLKTDSSLISQQIQDMSKEEKAFIISKFIPFPECPESQKTIPYFKHQFAVNQDNLEYAKLSYSCVLNAVKSFFELRSVICYYEKLLNIKDNKSYQKK